MDLITLAAHGLIHKLFNTKRIDHVPFPGGGTSVVSPQKPPARGTVHPKNLFELDLAKAFAPKVISETKCGKYKVVHYYNPIDQKKYLHTVLLKGVDKRHDTALNRLMATMRGAVKLNYVPPKLKVLPPKV